MAVCSVQGCKAEARSRGWCQSHYLRWYRNGDPQGGRTPNGVALAAFEALKTYDGDRAACYIWPYARNGRGYGTVFVGGKNRLVSRLLCEEANGAPASNDFEAAHNCGKGHQGCVNPHHLRWATRLQNAKDRQAHGTCKLTEADVVEILALKGTATQKQIAARYGVHHTLINHIHAGRRRPEISA